MASDPPYRVRAATLYCGSSQRVDGAYLEAAREFGERLASSGRTLVYGAGAIGLMGAASRGARAAGGRVVGVITRRLKDAEQMDPGNSENIVVRTMRERKALLEAWGDVLVVLPGGLGTLEEFFEVFTGRLLGEHDKPVILVSPPDPLRPGEARGFYGPMLAMLDHMVESGFAKAGALELLTVVGGAAEAIEAMDALERAGGPAAVDADSLLPTAAGD